MTYEEFAGWIYYFSKRPVDWRADDRAYKVLRTQGVKEKAWDVFGSLRPIYKPDLPADGRINLSNLKGSSLFNKMVLAKGGDSLEL